MDEQVLIARAQQGDSAAFEQLMQLHARFVYNLALRTVNHPQEAEDITQEAFVRVWKALPQFKGNSAFRTWLYRIVVNLCYNKLPKIKRELNAIDEEDAPEIPDERQTVDDGVMAAELRTTLRMAIDQLPESQRLLITLRHLQQLSYNEIAEATGMPLGTVKTGIFRARKQLKVTLLELGERG